MKNMLLNSIPDINQEILEKKGFKTPYFVISKKKLLDNYHEFKKLFPNSFIQYAMKANSEEEVLKMLAEAGSGFEVASIYEMNILKKLKIQPEKIVFGSSVKPAPHIKEFFEYGVDMYAADSLQELEKIAANAPGVKIYIRVAVNDAGSVFKFSEKFGTDVESAVILLIKAKEMGLIPYGISFHVGSQASNVDAWAHAIDHVAPALVELEKNGIQLEILNIGGGYPCNYMSSQNAPELKDIANSAMKAYKKLIYQPKIMLEPGRRIIADTSIAVASVIARVQRQGNEWLFLDLGVYNGLYEVMAYQGSTRYSVTSLRHLKDAGELPFSLAGPTGDSPDIISKDAILPADIEIGDKVIIHQVGAYSLVCTSPFNGFPKPKVYYS